MHGSRRVQTNQPTLSRASLVHVPGTMRSRPSVTRGVLGCTSLMASWTDCSLAGGRRYVPMERDLDRATGGGVVLESSRVDCGAPRFPGAALDPPPTYVRYTPRTRPRRSGSIKRGECRCEPAIDDLLVGLAWQQGPLHNAARTLPWVSNDLPGVGWYADWSESSRRRCGHWAEVK